LTYRLFPKLAPTATVYTSISTLVYGHTCIKQHRHWFIRAKHLGAADKVPRVADAPDLSPLLPRAVSGVEADMLITMGAHYIGGMVVSA
jgi:hypothetical protein